MLLTFGQAYDVVKAGVKPICDRTKILALVNEACPRLLYKGKWVGCYGRLAVDVRNGLITWPRELATIEGWVLDDEPLSVKNEWYEFLDSGPGLLEETDTHSNLVLPDRGIVPHGGWKLPSTTALNVGVKCNHGNDTGSRVLIRGFQGTREVVTLDGGSWITGEYVTLGASGSTVWTTNTFTRLNGVQKPETDGYVDLYADQASPALLSSYHPKETVPWYRQSLVPGLSRLGAYTATNGVDLLDTAKTLTVIGKLNFIPAVLDSDYLIPPYASAIKLMCRAIVHENDNLKKESMLFEADAVRLLNEQLNHHLGDAPEQYMKIHPILNANVENLI